MSLTKNELLVILENTQVQDKIKEIVETGQASATLKFPLPEYEYQFNVANSAMDIVSGCDDFRNRIRGWNKHDAHDFKTVDDVLSTLETLYYDLIGIHIPEE